MLWQKIKLLAKLDLPKWLYSLCSRKIGCKLLPYRHTYWQIDDTAILEGSGRLSLNCDQLPGAHAEALLRLDAQTRLTVQGDFQVFYGADITLYPGSHLTLGSGFLNAGGQIRCHQSITIGNQVAIGRDVLIQDGDGHTILDAQGQPRPNVAPVVIEDHVWLGARVVILKGVRIGEGAVIGAGTIVTKDVPPHTVVCGTPNRVIREQVTWR